MILSVLSNPTNPEEKLLLDQKENILARGSEDHVFSEKNKIENEEQRKATELALAQIFAKRMQFVMKASQLSEDQAMHFLRTNAPGQYAAYIKYSDCLDVINANAE